MTDNKTTRGAAARRLVTTNGDRGVTVRLKSSGLAALIARANAGDIAHVQGLLPKVVEDQRAAILAGMNAEARAAILGQPVRRAGKPTSAANETSPVAAARRVTGMTQAQLAAALGKTVNAIGNLESRGSTARLSTIAEAVAATGGTLTLLLTYPEQEARVPITPPDHYSPNK